MGQADSLQVNVEVIDESSLEQSWELIGAGGYSQVFKARHHRWGRDVVIKLLFCDGSSSEEDLAREAKLMLRAECPYVMRPLGIFKGYRHSSNFKCVGLVLDLMERGSLASLLRKQNHLLPWPLVFRLAHQVAMGINYLHSLTPALIHKNLKPGNILLDSCLNVKITDHFGLTRFADSVTVNNLRGVRTPFFAPPELGPATCAYDVYSYAMVLCSILGFDVSNGERPSLRDIERMNAPGLEELFELMVRCWNRNPDQRPPFTECTAVTEGLYKMHKLGIHDAVCQVQKELDGGILMDPRIESPVNNPHSPVPPGSTNRRDFLRHVCELTLDPNTAYRYLSLSENNRKVTCVREDQKYPVHPDSFTHWEQVMCRESLTGRCYWEIEWYGMARIAVTYKGIQRRSASNKDCFGNYDKSWCLVCASHRYTVMHKCEETVLSVRPSGSYRVGVYVDWRAGTVSFYRVSSDTLTHLHTFQFTFTEPLYAGFKLYPRCSVSLCQREEEEGG